MTFQRKICLVCFTFFLSVSASNFKHNFRSIKDQHDSADFSTATAGDIINDSAISKTRHQNFTQNTPNRTVDAAGLSPVEPTSNHRSLQDMSHSGTVEESNLFTAIEPMAAIIQRFISEHGLKNDINLNLITITDTNTMNVHGREYLLDDLQPMNVYSQDATFILDGLRTDLPPVAESSIFIGNQWGNTVLMTKGEYGEVQTIDIMGMDGSEEYMAVVSPGFLAVIKPEDLDSESVSNFSFDDVSTEENSDEQPPFRALKRTSSQSRYLRAYQRRNIIDRRVNEDAGKSQALQYDDSCSSFRIIEVATAFDSTFCALQGGATETRKEIEQIIARASMMYEQQGLCVQLAISHMEGYCYADSDPYRSQVSIGNIGCNDQRGVLQEFRSFWRKNRQSIHRDSAHLFYAIDSPDKKIGCASTEVLCDSNNAYGVNQIGFSADQQRRSILFAHELGHIIGLNHVQNENSTKYIMDSAGIGTHIWSQQSLDDLERLLPSHYCLSYAYGGEEVQFGAGDDDGVQFNSGDEESQFNSGDEGFLFGIETDTTFYMYLAIACLFLFLCFLCCCCKRLSICCYGSTK